MAKWGRHSSRREKVVARNPVHHVNPDNLVSHFPKFGPVSAVVAPIRAQHRPHWRSRAA
jgi:hypothetical protein